MNDSQRSIIIVGSGPGLGTAIARRFGAEGFRVGLIARRPPTLELDGVEVHTAVGDAGYTGSLHDAMDALTATLGVPDVLVYNPAVAVPGRPSTLDSVQLLASLATNVGGFVDAVQRVVQPMRVRRSGTILATGCGIALEPWADSAGLSAGKAALRTMVRALAKEVTDDDVHAAIVTVQGIMQPGTALAPEQVAEQFWRVYAQPRAEWEWERVFDPSPEN
ncbi:MAG TPA: SDR family NAD(P)-dependent oxidoreductase [Mycobacteriales bacterium]|nr:SDR family NAD(P)-dependent oxidoreductase [Mycobacteriales bacterium]